MYAAHVVPTARHRQGTLSIDRFSTGRFFRRSVILGKGVKSRPAILLLKCNGRHGHA